MTAPLTAESIEPVECYEKAQTDKLKPHPNAKKIFVFCDGTGNRFVDNKKEDGNSNVVKLYTTLRVADHQVAYYQPGVGTMGDPTIRYWLPRFWSKVKGLAFGAGFKDNVLDAYRYLMGVYNDGDQIYIFGFSRGAYTARALVGMLHGYGLLCRGNEKHVLYVWQMFHNALKKSRNRLKKSGHGKGAQSIERSFAFEQTYSRRVSIRFMGVWDTVSSIGWIYKPLRLLDMARNPIILVGRHAVSIDERRAMYRDNLWGDAYKCGEKDWDWEQHPAGVDQDLAQVWFPGVHSDIGGSYPQEQAAPANVTLEWMINELKNNGAELCQDRINMVLGIGSQTGHFVAKKLYMPKPTGEFHDSLKYLWWILQGFPQEYYDKDDGKIQWRVPYGVARRIPNGAYIHKSALKRIDATAGTHAPYKPRNITVDLKTCNQVNGPVAETRANLDGCYIYKQPLEPSSNLQTLLRWIKNIVGGICFGLFMAFVVLIAWYVLACGLSFLLWLCVVVAHAPGFRWLLPREIFRLY